MAARATAAPPNPTSDPQHTTKTTITAKKPKRASLAEEMLRAGGQGQGVEHAPLLKGPVRIRGIVARPADGDGDGEEGDGEVPPPLM